MHLLIIYLSAAIWLLRKVARRQTEHIAVHLFLWGVVLYLLIISTGPEAYSRFRVPVMPVLAIYAAGGLVGLAKRNDEKKYSVETRA